MINSKGKSIVSVAITTIVFLTLIFSATYAIIGATVVYDNTNIDTQLATRPIFTSTPSTEVSLSVQVIPTTVSSAYVISNAASSLSVALSTGYNVNTTCTYDIIWKWNTTSTTKNQYKITSGETLEFSISGTNGTSSFAEKQLANYGSDTKLYSGSINATGSTITKQTWDFTAKFYKTKSIQTTHLGATYAGQATVSNVVCTS